MSTHKCRHIHFKKQWCLLDKLWRTAQWALRYGATKDDLLSEIENALELHKLLLEEDGWLISPESEEQRHQRGTS